MPTDRETCGSIGLVGATDRISLSVSATGRRQGFFATDASEVGVGSASALSKIPLRNEKECAAHASASTTPLPGESAGDQLVSERERTNSGLSNRIHRS